MPCLGTGNAQREGMETTYVQASELKAGMTGFEQDGYPVDIIAILRETPNTITVQVQAQGCVAQRQPVEKTFRKSTRVLVAITEAT